MDLNRLSWLLPKAVCHLYARNGITRLSVDSSFSGSSQEVESSPKGALSDSLQVAPFPSQESLRKKQCSSLVASSSSQESLCKNLLFVFMVVSDHSNLSPYRRSGVIKPQAFVITTLRMGYHSLWALRKKYHCQTLRKKHHSLRKNIFASSSLRESLRESLFAQSNHLFANSIQIEKLINLK